MPDVSGFWLVKCKRWLGGKWSHSTGSWTVRMKRIPRDHPVPDKAPGRVSSKRKLPDCCMQTCSRTAGIFSCEDAPVPGMVMLLGRLSPTTSSPVLGLEMKQRKKLITATQIQVSELQRGYWVLKYLLRTHLCIGQRQFHELHPTQPPPFPAHPRAHAPSGKLNLIPTFKAL